MVWRTSYENVEAAHAIAAIVATLEPRLQGHGSPSRDGSIRIAVARSKDVSAGLFAEALFESLRFNGRSALANGPAYREFSFGGLGRLDYTEVAAQIARFEPTVVIFFANGDLVTAIESSWPASAAARPYYLTPSTLDADLLHFVGVNADRRHRLLGLTSVSTTVTNARFVLHYNETFADAITRAWAPNSSYDAFYLVAYSAYALGERAITGRALAEAFGRLLPPGTPVDVGATGILGAFGLLSAGQSVDLNGATGSLDFDPHTGEAPVDLAVVCAGIDAHGAAVEAIESGVVFDGKTGTLVGERHCP
jgi:hypothetical protein